jgi:hypothetical protein
MTYSPFLMILPTGNVFAGYYNEARILDKTTFNTVKALPNMPGSVNDFLAGRTYPVSCLFIVCIIVLMAALIARRSSRYAPSIRS